MSRNCCPQPFRAAIIFCNAIPFAAYYNQSEINYRIQAIGLKTGKVRKELSTRDPFNVGHHHRCYRNKITERFLTSSRRGVEFVNLDTGEQQQHHWVRGGCLLGALPCNGLGLSSRRRRETLHSVDQR